MGKVQFKRQTTIRVIQLVGVLIIVLRRSFRQVSTIGFDRVLCIIVFLPPFLLELASLECSSALRFFSQGMCLNYTSQDLLASALTRFQYFCIMVPFVLYLSLSCEITTSVLDLSNTTRPLFLWPYKVHISLLRIHTGCWQSKK